MPIGFNLYSFDFFEAFRRGRQGEIEMEIVNVASRSAASANDKNGDERSRDQVNAHAFWGLGYYPVL